MNKLGLKNPKPTESDWPNKIPKRTWFILYIILYSLAALIIFSYFVGYWQIEQGISSKPDNFCDLYNYYEEAKYFWESKKPLSEYPPPALFVFLLIYVLTIGNQPLFFLGCEVIFIAAQVGIGIILADYLVRNESLSPFLLFLLSPTTLFLSSMRYDSIPTFFVLAAIYSFQKWKSKDKAAIFLALSFSFKFYALFLFPLFLFRLTDEKEHPHLFRFMLLFAGTVALCFAPFLIWPDWMEFLIRFHMERRHVGESIFFLPFFSDWLGSPSIRTSIFIIGGLFACLLVFQTRFKPLEYQIAVILLWVTLYSYVWSPQYLIWILPFLYMPKTLGQHSLGQWTVFLLDLLTILAYPVFYNIPDPYSLDWAWAKEFCYFMTSLRLIAHTLVFILLLRIKIPPPVENVDSSLILIS
ncbi:MAG: hypothetical protein ACFFGZ_18215 [Candidatus Thorarchaeota archaeon]